MIVLVGKSCSGKDRVRSELLKLGYNKIVTYTTRPPRDGEINGESYFFISDDEFDALNLRGFFAETTEYDTTKGIWKYGTSVSSIRQSDDNTVIIVNTSGLKSLKSNELIKDNVIAFYLNVSDEELLNRANNRKNSDKEEINRRFAADKKDFEGITTYVDMIVNNENIDPKLITELIDWSYKKISKGEMHNWLE